MNFTNNHNKIFIAMCLKSHLKSKVPSYLAILIVTIMSNGFNNTKKKMFFFNYFNYPLPPNKNETLFSIFKVRSVEYRRHYLKLQLLKT
jgi:hypothetical protein